MFLNRFVHGVRYEFAQYISTDLVLETGADNRAWCVALAKAGNVHLSRVGITYTIVGFANYFRLYFNFYLFACWRDVNQFCLHQKYKARSRRAPFFILCGYLFPLSVECE